MTEGTKQQQERGQQQGRGIDLTSRNTPLFTIGRVAGWLILPLYVAGVCAGYLLERGAGLPVEHFVDNVVLWIGFGAFAMVGALLVAKRPTNLVGWIMTTVALWVGLCAILPRRGGE